MCLCLQKQRHCVCFHSKTTNLLFDQQRDRQIHTYTHPCQPFQAMILLGQQGYLLIQNCSLLSVSVKTNNKEQITNNKVLHMFTNAQGKLYNIAQTPNVFQLLFLSHRTTCAHLTHIPAALLAGLWPWHSLDVALFNLALWASLIQHQPFSDGK